MTLYHGPDLSLGPVSLCLPDVHEIENAPAAVDTLEARDQWLSRAISDSDVLYFAVRVDGLLAGQIFLHGLGQKAGEAQVGLHLFDPAMRGRGVGAAALALLQGYAAGQAGLKRLVFEVAASQVAAVRAAEKCGFRRKGKSKTDPLQVVYHWDVPAA
jgi:RimJ/RimL family protein N-acetyltransferase